ncbi:MAG TPA: SulP family inorganic anion transporter [Methylomirabilota bacterium]|nr:SulP family inorganic anion transporter [Methylomirabilota bacterium]
MTRRIPGTRTPRAARFSLAHLKGDIAGGVTSAILTIPVSMGYGILSFQSLGDRYVSYAILAGLYSAIIVPIVAVLLGANTTMMYAPRSVVSFLLGSVVLHTLVRSRTGIVDVRDVGRTLTLALLVVFLAGLFQALFGAFRLGSLVQYIPSPVMAGFQNAAAILMFLAQLDTLLGFRQHVPPFEIAAHLSEVRPLTLLVGLVTALAMWQGGRLIRTVPPVITGLAAGIGAHYLIKSLGQGAGLGSVIGAMPSAVPSPQYLLGFVSVVSDHELWRLLPALTTGALSLAIIASLDGLLCAKTVEGVTGQKPRGNQELLRLGVGNMVAACFGGISSGVNLGSSFANHRAGGRTPASVMVTGLVILIALLLLSPVLAFIPRAVIAGMLLVVALQLFDRWSIRVVRQMLTGEFVYWKSMTLDLAVVVLVAAVAIVVNLVVAVGIGVGVAILSFLFRMSKSVVRRAYRGDTVRSRRTREPRQMEILAARGGQILVLELEGPIFFGTAEDLSSRVDAALREGVAYVVLDLKRVNEIDSTGARILLQVHQKVAQRGGQLLVSHLRQSRRLAHFLQDMGVTALLTPQRLFPDTDRALEWAEDRVIAGELRDAGGGEELPLQRVHALAGLTPAEQAALSEMLVRRSYAKGEVVFREGDPGRELFIITKGMASAKIRLGDDGGEHRLATFSAGTVFGEVALLDEQPRSATVEADEELVCHVLSVAAFETLARQDHATAIKLLTNLSRELSSRLRRANQTISELES